MSTRTEQKLREARAQAVVRRFTMAAAATGAIPVPAASVAIVTENAAMINCVASAMGVEVSLGTVLASLGWAQAVNQFGRMLFVEGARTLNPFTGGAGTAFVCALGATTAAMQTWIVGQLTIAICRHGGRPLPAPEARRVVEEARRTYQAP